MALFGSELSEGLRTLVVLDEQVGIRD